MWTDLTLAFIYTRWKKARNRKTAYHYKQEVSYFRVNDAQPKEAFLHEIQIGYTTTAINYIR